jgi:hypothetical protein
MRTSGNRGSRQFQEADMRRTTPDLVGQRKKTYDAVSIGLLALSIIYAVWTNYVVFVGGNLPLTSIHLSDGSFGAGLAMLAVGDLALVLVLWFVVANVLLNLLHMILLARQRTRTPSTAQPAPQPTQTASPIAVPAQAAGSAGGSNQWESQQWPPQGQQWQPQGQQWPPQEQQQPPQGQAPARPPQHNQGSPSRTADRPAPDQGERQNPSQAEGRWPRPPSQPPPRR